MLTVTSLCKSYGGRTVVNDLSLMVGAGEIVGLLGPNGAGKSTSVSMICGGMPADAGEVWIGNHRLIGEGSEVKRRIGLVPQDLALYEELPAQANLNLFGALYGLSRTQLRERSAQLLELVGLTDRATDLPATFSGGMKRRLNIACALMHEPDVLLLDEPTVGVDPQGRMAIFDCLLALRERGKAIVYTTHYMEEAERLCDRVVIVDHGRVIASGSVEQLLAVPQSRLTVVLQLDADVDTVAVARLPGVREATQSAGALQLVLGDLGHYLLGVLDHLIAQGHRVNGIQTGRASLEDVFLTLTGRQLRD